MRITKFGHACLLIEEGESRVLIDPGAFSQGFGGLTGLAAILITHQHPDHLVVDNLVALLHSNPEAQLLADAGSARIISDDGRVQVHAVKAGDALEIDGLPVRVEGSEHATIFPDIPTIPNVGYWVTDRFFYPGDNFTKPAGAVEILALPLGAPWLKVSEVIDYVRAVRPKVAVPVHDAVLAMPDMHVSIVRPYADQVGTKIEVIPNGAAADL